jgi:aryl-alcohol dehydrogenase-like predicted oxidoreductase
MEMRRLGVYGPLVSSVSLGAMGVSGTYGPSTEAETMRLFARAVDVGVNHFDTADIYGMGLSEELIGRFLKQTRARIVISTKAGIRFIPATGERRVDNSAAYIRGSLEKSLKRLGRDHIELFYLGRRDPNRPIDEVMETLAQLKREGKIGAIGLSEVSPETLRQADKVHRIAAVQSEFSLWTRDIERTLLKACADLRTTFVAFAPLGRGMLTGLTPDPAAFTNGDFRRAIPRFQEPAFSQNRAALNAYKELCQRLAKSPAQVALAWILSAGEHVIAAAAALKLTDEQRRQIAAAFPAGFPWGERFSSNQSIGIESSH